jgi:hypothetical protein
MLNTKDRKDITASYHPENNSYGIFNYNKSFKCRESFEFRWREYLDRNIYFNTAGPKILGIEALHNKIVFLERKLSLDDESEFGFTQNANICWIKPLYFWKHHPIKRSLFTALLRGCSNSGKFDLESIINAEYTLCTTKNAVHRFFDSNTNINISPEINQNMGWQHFFNDSNQDKLEQLLTV